jgi:hypothetical protein
MMRPGPIIVTFTGRCVRLLAKRYSSSGRLRTSRNRAEAGTLTSNVGSAPLVPGAPLVMLGLVRSSIPETAAARLSWKPRRRNSPSLRIG